MISILNKDMNILLLKPDAARRLNFLDSDIL